MSKQHDAMRQALIDLQKYFVTIQPQGRMERENKEAAQRMVLNALAVPFNAYDTPGDEAVMMKIGNNIAEMLCMRRDREHRDRWQTTWGNKTGLGLFRTLIGLSNDMHDGDLHKDLTA